MLELALALGGHWDLPLPGTFRLVRFRSFRLFHFRLFYFRLHITLSTSANPNTVTDITPFIVKNAASSFERLPGRTSWCS